MENQKRDVVLAPGQYAYMQDITKGQIRVLVGPCVYNPTAQDVPVIFSSDSKSFERATLESVIQKSAIAVEGYYLVLTNPAKDGTRPEEGTSRPAPELTVGRKVNIPGPCMFALWPGQTAQMVKGHTLRSNQYLLVRVYNEEEAKRNWHQAVMKPADRKPDEEGGKTEEKKVTAEVPKDLSVGKLLIIRGTEVSFYIPPTGISVVPDGEDDNGQLRYIRDALTLERLEYAILVSESGTKRFERGPQVVFPGPTERFMEGKSERSGSPTRKFKAIELNEIQGLHIKVIAPYKEGEKVYKEGDELFVTGKETAIYFPREEHSIIRYDGRDKHFATAVPAGEARYVMDRMTGQIETVIGPAMLLPDPRTKVIVRRVLSDKQASLWYPGNQEVLAYNQALRAMLAKAPTTRSGVISEGDFERGAKKASAEISSTMDWSPIENATMSLNALYTVEPAEQIPTTRSAARGAQGMQKSNQNRDQRVQADALERQSGYTTPRTLVLDTKFQGVPSVDIWTGYAVNVVSKTGKRRVEVGPKTLLLAYDESLEVLELSTGKPKTTDKPLRTVYLRAKNNKVADIVEFETKDHVVVKAQLNFQIDFEGDQEKWFDVENYIKYFCDHVRSVLKGAAKRETIQNFWAGAIDFVRDTILGAKGQDGKRPGMSFEANGMRITDVDVLTIQLADAQIANLLFSTQKETIESSIQQTRLERKLTNTRFEEDVNRQLADVRTETEKQNLHLQQQLIAEKLKVNLSEIASRLTRLAEEQKAKQEELALAEMQHEAERERKRLNLELDHDTQQKNMERQLAALREETEACVKRFAAAQTGFSEALLALSRSETVVKVAESLSVQQILGGKNFVEVVQKVFEGSPLQDTMSKLTKHLANGNAPKTLPSTNGPTA